MKIKNLLFITKKYFRIWWILTTRTTQVAFASRFGAAVFLIGKILRFSFFLLFLIVLVTKTKSIAGYNFWQIIFFYATFNLIDTLPQFFLREVYRFRYQIVIGSFDHILVKPLSPLFRALFGGCDLLDLSTLFLSILFIIVSILNMDTVTTLGIILYLLFIINSFLIALSFHITVVALGVVTTEVDNAIMIYRDVTQMGRFPIDIYKEPIKGIITFIIPVGIMMTFPAKSLLGLLSFPLIAVSFLMSGLLLFLSLLFWKYSLKHYSSASS